MVAGGAEGGGPVGGWRPGAGVPPSYRLVVEEIVDSVANLTCQYDISHQNTELTPTVMALWPSAQLATRNLCLA